VDMALSRNSRCKNCQLYIGNNAIRIKAFVPYRQNGRGRVLTGQQHFHLGMVC
jgi:hypothetical protein